MPKVDGYNHFKKIGKQYYLTDYVGILLQQMSVISLVFHVKTNGEATLVKYGSYDSVLYWFQEKEKNYPIKANELLLVFTSDDWEVEQLNKLLSNYSYANKFYNALKGACHENNGKRGSDSLSVGEGKQI